MLANELATLAKGDRIALALHGDALGATASAGDSKSGRPRDRPLADRPSPAFSTSAGRTASRAVPAQRTVTAPSEAEVTSRAYLARTPWV